MDEMKEQLRQAKQYFKSEAAYKKLFSAFRKKYESLGRIGGTVPIRDFSDTELEEIGKFFGLLGDQLRKKGTISLRAFEEQFQYTRFSSVTLKEVLDDYFGEKLISKKEQQQEKEAQRQKFFQNLKSQFPNLAFWLDYIVEQRREVRWIWQIADNDSKYFVKLAASLDKAISNLPKEAERLPLFSQRITSDPHAFDLQTDLGRMFIHVLSVHDTEQEVPTTTEEINLLLQQYHIYRDDLLNFVTCANLLAKTEDGVHPVWEAAIQSNTVQIVPLRELIKIISVYPANGNVVWVVENSGVCATLLDYKRDVPIVCTNGQFTLATLMLLDFLVDGGNELYYAGDLDPEGLGMAGRLLERYEGAVRLWHMDVEAYQKSKPVTELSAERLEKLNSIQNDRLVEIANEMRRIGKAGYQEALVDLMVADITNGVL